MAGVYVGIDLGTTYSVAAIVRDGRPEVLPNAIGEFLTPSAVSEDEGGRMLVGAAASARLTTNPAMTAVVFKRSMGTNRTFRVGSKELRPEELSALVLKKIANDVEEELGASITEAVVTVPAYFGEAQRRATRDACELAGLRVERIINEPTAAALAFGLDHSQEEVRAVVLDLGGGTFDVSVLEIMEGVVEIQGTAGDARLGGEDFVGAMIEKLQPLVEEAVGGGRLSELARARLHAACERAKRELSQADVFPLRLSADDTSADSDFEFELRRADVEGWWEPLVARMRDPIRSALLDAGVAADDIDVALLVGGATRMPMFRRFADSIFPGRARSSLPPDEAVAMGAAIQAALKADQGDVEDLVVTDIAPFSMGISVQSEVGHRHLRGVFAPIIERGTVLPISREDVFFTTLDDQRELLLEVYQGENTMCSDNSRLGQFRLKRLPPAAAGEVPISVRFTYDLNGMLEVEATIPAHKKHHRRVESFVVEREPGVMTLKEIALAREAMERIKFHPREALPNKVALERAEALHARLLGDARSVLRDAIVDFRSALEAQRGQEIEERRRVLVDLCERLEWR